MIILDTNVVSEPMRLNSDEKVVAWLDKQVVDTLFITSISFAELLFGIENLPKGKRKTGLTSSLSELMESLFQSRILPFDTSAASAYAPLMARARESGQAISFADGQIAAIAQSRGFTIATRDTAPFIAAGLSVINPWEE